MTGAASKLLKEAMGLAEKDRALLAASLIESLEVQVDPGYKAAWDDEIARRIRELEDGTVKPISWAEARKRIMAAAHGQTKTRISSSGSRRDRSRGSLVRRSK